MLDISNYTLWYTYILARYIILIYYDIQWSIIIPFLISASGYTYFYQVFHNEIILVK